MSKIKKARFLGSTWLINIIVMVFSLSCVFPYFWMIYSSFKTEAEFKLDIISLPKVLSFDNFINAVKIGRMNIYIWNSIFNSIITVILVTICAFVVGYFISRFSFVGRRIIYLLFVAGMLIPVHSLLVPIFTQFRMMGMLDNRFTLLPVYFSFGMPMAVFLVESFLSSIPIELEEAAMIDGSNMVRTMFTIIFPLCRPVVATTTILTFMNVWNEFPFALVLIRSETLRTIPLGLRVFQGAYTANYTQFMAGMLISLIPVMLVYVLFYKKIIVGMTSGTIKG